MIFSGRRLDYGVHGPFFRRWFAWYPVILRGGSVAWMRTVAVRYADLGHLCSEYQWERCEISDPWVKQVGLT